MSKLTVKQENFCCKYVELGNASEAYRLAYDASNMKPETINVKASELLKNGKVSVRVDELKAQHAERHAVTVDTITQELEEARLMAIVEKQSSAAISASMGKAKIHGLVVDKAVVKSDVNVTLENILEDLDGTSADLPST